MAMLNKVLGATVIAAAALGMAAAAHAGKLSAANGYHALLAPEAGSDGLYLTGYGYFPIDDASNYTGIVSTGIADGVGVAMQDHDLVGTESGGPPSDSDYVYVYQNTLYFDGDSETSIPILSNPVDRAGFGNIFEDGTYQDVGNFFGVGAGVLYAYSDVAVPEPAAWTMMLVGFGLTGGLLRRRVFRAAALQA